MKNTDTDTESERIRFAFSDGKCCEESLNKFVVKSKRDRWREYDNKTATLKKEELKNKGCKNVRSSKRNHGMVTRVYWTEFY